MNKLQLYAEGDRYVVAERSFAAPRDFVFRAHTDPALLQRWMLGPDGWTMTECISEAHPGGKIRFAWSDGQGASFSLTGEYVEVTPSRRLVHVERMHLPETTPDNHVDTTFEPDGEGTRLRLHMTLPDAQSRDGMLASGMEHGMEASYARLEAMASSITG